MSIDWSQMKTVEQLETERLEQATESARNQRDRLLTETDWVAVKHNELGAPIPQEWLDYRQALRDITEQSGFPDNVEWPTAPLNHEESN